MITGFVFGFDDKQSTFILSGWIFNYLKFVILSFIAWIVYFLTQNHFSKVYGCNIDYKIWSIERFGFAKGAHLPLKFGKLTIKKIPLGIILPILISFLSDGGLYFTAVISSIVSIVPAYRLGRMFTKLTEIEEAKVAVSGPLSLIGLAVLIKIFDVEPLNELVLVSSMIALSNMFPLPGLDGIKVLFGSRLWYIFSASFVLASAFLLNFVSGFSALILGLLIALFVLFHYFYKKNQS